MKRRGWKGGREEERRLRSEEERSEGKRRLESERVGRKGGEGVGNDSYLPPTFTQRGQRSVNRCALPLHT